MAAREDSIVQQLRGCGLAGAYCGGANFDVKENVMNIYNEAAADVGDLVHGWTTFQRLSRHERNVTVLNAANPHFAGVVQAALRTYAVTIAARLLERPISAGKRTASLEALLNESNVSEHTRVELVTRLNDIRKAAESTLEYRHKRVAHTDYAVRAEKAEGRIPSSAEFDAVVQGLLDFMERFETAAGLHVIPYENSSGARDVDEIVRLLSERVPSR